MSSLQTVSSISFNSSDFSQRWKKKFGVKLFEATNKSVSWKEQMSQKTLLEQIANKDEEWESKSDLRRKEKVHLHLFH